MFFNVKPNPNLKVSVIIPVKDEAESICYCLDALRKQRQEDGTPFPTEYYEILVLTNNCQDNSYLAIKNYQDRYPKLPLLVEDIVFAEERANIGTARRFLMDKAFDRFTFLKKPQGIIASTDGDTKVDKFWIYEIVKEMEKGCDVVGGEIITEIANGSLQHYHLQDIRYHNLIARLEDLIDPLPYNPWPSHFQCFGASLAVTCDMYEKAGRIPSIPFLEDVAFYKALELKDAKIRKSRAVKVYTSSRTLGRVERGLSQQLAWFESLNNEHRVQEVECAAAVISKLKIRRNIRACWHNRQVCSLPSPFLKQDLQQWLNESKYFGELWAKAEGYLQNAQWFGQWNDEPVEKVIYDLHRCVVELRETGDTQSAIMI